MKTFKKILKWVGIVAGVLALAIFALFMIYVRPVLTKIKKTEVINYDKDLTIILGGGGNSGILVSDSLVIVIDTKMDEAAGDLAKKAKELAGTKPILVINTHYHSDHCGGNHLFNGSTIIAGGNYTKEAFAKDAGEKIWLING